MSPETATTRDRLIEVAMRLFHEQGYGATGVAQILKEAEAKSGSLYYYFPAKEDLLLAVLEQYKKIMKPALMAPVFERYEDPLDQVFGLLEKYRDMLIKTNCTLGCPIGNIALELADSHEEVRRLCGENFDNWKSAVGQCLEEAGDHLRPDVNGGELASFFLTVMEGGIMQARAYRSIKPFDAAIATLRDYVKHLLKEDSTWSAGRDRDID